MCTCTMLELLIWNNAVLIYLLTNIQMKNVYKNKRKQKKETILNSKNSTCAFKKHAYNLMNVYNLDIKWLDILSKIAF